jgi:hypothetical protein
MKPPAGTLGIVLVCALPLIAHAQPRPATPEPDLLARARSLYNQQDYDGAITAAIQARERPGSADAADLVLARAYLERFRKTGDRTDLVIGRETLAQIQSTRLPPRERVELLVGLGEALYLDGLYGASAELFESALAHRDAAGQPPAALAARARDQVLDWWATALDREAQSRFSTNRAAPYARMLAVMQDELADNAGSAPATYWLVMANRAVGDLDRAWDSAIAGWVRAALAGDGSGALRADLDRVVLQALIPERARLIAAPDRDTERVAEELRAEWEGIKRDWK